MLAKVFTFKLLISNSSISWLRLWFVLLVRRHALLEQFTFVEEIHQLACYELSLPVVRFHTLPEFEKLLHCLWMSVNQHVVSLSDASLFDCFWLRIDSVYLLYRLWLTFKCNIALLCNSLILWFFQLSFV